MLRSKGILTPLIPDCSVLRTLTILKNIRNPLIFLRKMATYSCFLAGLKFRNLPASKLASDFRPFDPDILSCSGLFYNLSYTHVVHIYQHLYLIFSTFYRTLFTPEAYSATSSSVSFSAFFISPSENTSLPTKRPPAG